MSTTPATVSVNALLRVQAGFRISAAAEKALLKLGYVRHIEIEPGQLDLLITKDGKRHLLVERLAQ